MKIARVLMVGAHRIGNACLSLKFDKNLNTFDQTIVVSPLPADRINRLFQTYTIDTTGFEYITDYELLEQYPAIATWNLGGDYRGSWLLQQAMKLHMLDHVDADVIFIQDADSFCTDPYDCVVDGKLNLFYLPNVSHTWEYYRAFENITALPRQTPHCFVCDMMPIFKSDWTSLKESVAERFEQPWTDIFLDQTPWDYVANVKWFSEYELLANWAMSQHSQYQLTEQLRFEFKSIEQLTHNDFPNGFNCSSDKSPQGRILPFDYGNDTVQNLDLVLDRFHRLGLLPE